jgi:hypothetical protein
VSALLTPVVLVTNVWNYVICCFTMKPVPAGACPPKLTPEAVQRLTPFADRIEEQLKKGTNVVHVAGQIAAAAGVTPGQVMLFLWVRRRERGLKKNTEEVIEIPLQINPPVEAGTAGQPTR